MEAAGRKLEREKVLLPNLTAAVLAGHGREDRAALDTDRHMPQSPEGRQVAPRAATEIQYAQRRRSRNVPQQRLDVLLDIVIARAGPEFGGAFVVVLERPAGNECQ